MSSSAIGLRRNAFGFSAPLRKFLAATLASVSLRDAVVVQVAVGLHPEELRGQVLPVLGIPAGIPTQAGILGEGAARMFVEADAMPMS